MRRAIVLLAVALSATACDREIRKLSKEPDRETRPEQHPVVGPQPGAPGPGIVEIERLRSYDGDNAYEMSQGKRLFRWFNCSGCHSSGGGGMGPPLMDEKWIYGHAPEQIYATIMEGRPAGMPSFKGRITQEQAWQLVAYVRAMGGLAKKTIAPVRGDALGGVEPEAARPRLDPKAVPPPSPDK